MNNFFRKIFLSLLKVYILLLLKWPQLKLMLQTNEYIRGALVVGILQVDWLSGMT